MSEKETFVSCLRQAHCGPCNSLGCISIWESYDDDKKNSKHENKKIKINHSSDNKEIINNTPIVLSIQPVQKCGLHVAHDGPCNDPKCVFKLVC